MIPVLPRDGAQFADALFIVELVDRADIKAHQVHIRLKERGELLDIVILNDQEPGTATGEVVQPLDPIRINGSRFVLLNETAGDFLVGRARKPGELAVGHRDWSLLRLAESVPWSMSSDAARKVPKTVDGARS